METFSALLAICAGNSPVPGEFPAKRPVTRSFDVCFFICVWINGWVNNRQAGDLRRYRSHYGVTVMVLSDEPGQFYGLWWPGDARSLWHYQSISWHNSNLWNGDVVVFLEGELPVIHELSINESDIGCVRSNAPNDYCHCQNIIHMHIFWYVSYWRKMSVKLQLLKRPHRDVCKSVTCCILHSLESLRVNDKFGRRWV